MDALTNSQVLEISIALAGSLLIGWLVKRFLFPFFYKITHKTPWKSDDLIIQSIASWVIFWFFLGACLYVLPLFTEAYSLDSKIEILAKDIIGSLYVVSFSFITGRILVGLLQIHSQNDDGELASTSILGNIAKVIVYIIGFILILKIFGVEIAPFVTALGVGGLAVALALQSTLSNLFAGLQIIASGKLNVGDFVQLEGGQKGFIRDITWRNTTIETVQNNVVIVPNSKMADTIVENFFLTDREVTFNVLAGVSYDSDLEKVERVAIEVAKDVLEKHPGGIKDFEPYIRFYNFGDSSIDMKIFLRVKEYADQFEVTSAFIKSLHQRFGQEGINIPFPIRTVYLNQQQPK